MYATARQVLALKLPAVPAGPTVRDIQATESVVSDFSVPDSTYPLGKYADLIPCSQSDNIFLKLHPVDCLDGLVVLHKTAGSNIFFPFLKFRKHQSSGIINYQRSKTMSAPIIPNAVNSSKALVIVLLFTSNCSASAR